MVFRTGSVKFRSHLVKNILRVAVVGIALFHPVVLAAQDTRGGLVGTVVDRDGNPLSSVRVTVNSPSLLGSRVLDTDASGRFRFEDLPGGFYNVRLARIGLQPVEYSGARVLLGVTTSFGEVELGTPVEMETIRVLAQRPPIDPVSPAMSSVIDASSFAELPIARDYQSMIAILPHANESFLGDGANIGGSTGLENAYFVDGVNVTDPFVGAGGTRLPHNFIQSVQVRTGGYEAEYGRALGGIVNAVTYTGSNRFEGSVFGYYAGSALADDPRVGLVDLGSERSTTFDVGVRAGGPLVRDRAWFSLAYNPRVESADRIIPGHGEFEDRMTLHSFASKLNWRPAASTDIELSVFGDPSTHRQIGPAGNVGSAPGGVASPDPLLNVIEEGGLVGSLRLRHRVGSRFVVRAHLSRSNTRSSSRPDTVDGVLVPRVVDVATNVWSGGSGFLEDVRSGRTTAALSATFLLRSHALKTGVEYQTNKTDFRRWVQTIVRENSALFQLESENTGSANNPEPHWNRTVAIFLQDSWQVSARLAVNAGLRWSRQQLRGVSASQTFPNEWQPRAGAVYQLGQLGTQRLFGSVGRFYQQIPVRHSAVYYAPYDFGFEFFSSDPRLPGVLPDSGGIFHDPGTYPEISNVQAEHLDEFTLGYERLLPEVGVLRVRGIRRVLRSAFGFGIVPAGFDFQFFIGNYGEGDLSFLPRPSRNYTGLEITLALADGRRLQGQFSYVLSRTQGNYSGLFGSDHGLAVPNGDYSWQFAEQGPNSTGLLPGDRTHVAKLFASYQFGFGLTAGTFATVQSGSPLNRFGAGTYFSDTPVFLVSRGSAGRSPALWDLNFRFAFDLPFAGNTTGRILLDVLHVGSPRRATWLEQFQFLGRDLTGAQSNLNPNFMQPNTYQPPMTVRLGFEVGF